MKFSLKYFFSKCDQISSFLRIWSHLLKKSLMENFIFCPKISYSGLKLKYKSWNGMGMKQNTVTKDRIIYPDRPITYNQLKLNYVKLTCNSETGKHCRYLKISTNTSFLWPRFFNHGSTCVVWLHIEKDYSAFSAVFSLLYRDFYRLFIATLVDYWVSRMLFLHLIM